MSLLTRNGKNERLADFEVCTGCGTCYAMCPSGAIELRIDGRMGVYRPEIDGEKCTGCGICSEVCPGKSLNIESIAHSIYGPRPKDAFIGNLEGCYIAHATDYDIRYGSSSGGLVTALLILALEEGLIDGALVTRMNRSDPLLPEPFIAKTRDDILSASRSKYCPVPANAAVRVLNESEGRFAVVGLPCHLHGIRKAELASEALRQKISLHFGLFCSHTLSFHATRHLLARMGAARGEVAGVDYRGHGWPGGIAIRMRNGDGHFIPSHSPLWALIFGSHFFTPKCCLWCTDLTSELSDLSFGDPWLPGVIKGEKIGRSLVISRTREGENLLRLAREKGTIKSEVIDSEAVVRSQATSLYFKKGNINMRRRIGMPSSVLTQDWGGVRGTPVGSIIALTAILNSSLGRSQLFRVALKRTPTVALRFYSLVADLALKRERDEWIG